MTTDPCDRIAELGVELQSLAEEMRKALAELRAGHASSTRFGMCEARVIAVAAELRVIIAGHRGV